MFKVKSHNFIFVCLTHFGTSFPRPTLLHDMIRKSFLSLLTFFVMDWG